MAEPFVVELKEQLMNIEAESEFQIRQMHEIIYKKLTSRGIDASCLDQGRIEQRGMRAHQVITVREGLDKELAKKIVKIIKDTKMKVQAAIQGDQVRVTGKKPGTYMDIKGKSCTYGVTLIKDAPNREAAVAFLEYMLDPQGGLRVLKAMGQPPFVPCRVPAASMQDRLPETLQVLVEIKN